MGLLRWPLRRSRDPYWDAFVNRPLADPANVITEAIRHAPEGRIFPARSELPEPARLLNDLDQLVAFLGGSAIGVARTETAFLRPGDDSGASPDPAELAEDLPFTVVIAVHAEHHPDKAKGMAGQHVLHESASVNFSIAAYIRELGYRATVRPVDSAAAAKAAGLEPGRGEYVGDAVLTDLPLPTGRPGA
ncbi:MAG: hypothetical protein OXL97_09425 [Chloroflexota bacterium]|nr:hypothetical protein [Chloroflexota bacterium]MDE2885538.1 hypothetical protein [Chloroflexota bacterium]